MQIDIFIDFDIGCEIDCEDRIPKPIFTRNAQTIVENISNLHESAGEGCKYRNNLNRNEEDDRNGNADLFTSQPIKPTVGLPELLVLRGFEMAPS